MHSATKYIGGHSDLLGGLLVARDQEVGEQLHWMQNATGAVMGPLESFLCCRGVKTLELRVHAQSATALRLASWLRQQSSVKRVYYPGLDDDPGHAVAAKQYHGGFGAMVSFEIDSDVQGAQRFVESTRLFQLAVSLGAVESLIEVPALMSHGAYAPEARRAVGITDGLIRLSVGLEEVGDLEEDLSQAMDSLSAS
jgi:cystathionine beta-lyase/cystathionine gamma-synthase